MGWIVVRPTQLGWCRTLVIHGGSKTWVAVARVAMNSSGRTPGAIPCPRRPTGQGLPAHCAARGNIQERHFFSSAYDHSGISESWGHRSVITTGPDYPRQNESKCQSFCCVDHRYNDKSRITHKKLHILHKQKKGNNVYPMPCPPSLEPR